MELSPRIKKKEKTPDRVHIPDRLKLEKKPINKVSKIRKILIAVRDGIVDGIYSINAFIFNKITISSICVGSLLVCALFYFNIIINRTLTDKLNKLYNIAYSCEYYEDDIDEESEYNDNQYSEYEYRLYLKLKKKYENSGIIK